MDPVESAAETPLDCSLELECNEEDVGSPEDLSEFYWRSASIHRAATGERGSSDHPF